MSSYTQSMYGTSARDINKSNGQTVCDFCSYGCHARRDCVLRKRLAGEIVALSNTFYRKKRELRQTIRLPHFQQKHMRIDTNIKQNGQQQHSSNIHLTGQMDIQQRLIDTKSELTMNGFMPKPPRFANNANLNEDQKTCANRTKANVFSPPAAEGEKVASFYKIYLARIQSKIPPKPLERNFTCPTDQSAAKTIEWFDCFDGHDLSADLYLLFNDSTEIGNERNLYAKTEAHLCDDSTKNTGAF